ncbi:MAG TPA: CFI-box-CTERM domain-containing protein [Dehalococcoidia bacterium]
MDRHIRVTLATLLIVTGVLVFLPSSYVSAGGMVFNQSFEEGAGEVPLAWNLTGNATRVDTGPIYAGNWTARITSDNDTLTQWLWVGNLTIPLTYDAWGWMYVTSNVTSNVTGVIAFDFWAGEEGTQLSSTTELTATDTNGIYVQRSSLIQAPICTTHLRIRLLGKLWNNGGEVRFDEIGFFPVTGFCFIATAAYGTETASQLDILRDFRDQVLLENALGSRFVEAYYRVSPPVADFIAKNDFLRAVVREALVEPVVNLLQWSQDLWRA